MNDNIESSPITVIPGNAGFLERVEAFLQPFVEQEFLLPRTRDELSKLLMLSFVAVRDEEVVGFAAVEIYSRKLAEIQCLAVSSSLQRKGIGKQLVQGCVDVAREQGVKELMAISASDAMFVACGFTTRCPTKNGLCLSARKKWTNQDVTQSKNSGVDNQMAYPGGPQRSRRVVQPRPKCSANSNGQSRTGKSAATPGQKILPTRLRGVP